ncbi:MAG TPA: magnesium protoporphyrin IX methyltransferase [Pseudomonadales bacterium]|nr:magnesium protoporphyrin IX methyltransferase [Pseudomonadales bacterium]
MEHSTYRERRGEIERYFDRTALENWARLTSDAPVSGIRATVRAGRDRMRALLLDLLGADLSGQRILDAGCGTGALAVEAARRGAHVVGIDVSPSLIDIARERLPEDLGSGSVTLLAGDMLGAEHGDFDQVVAMDSLIHYQGEDVVAALAGLAARTRGAICFTFAPRTPLLAAMHAVGQLFPRSDRSPAIVPLAEARLRAGLDGVDALAGWQLDPTARVASGFYTSQAARLGRTLAVERAA